MNTSAAAGKPKHKLIFNVLRNDIHNKKYKLGDRLPSEIQLASQFAVSRPTIGKALGKLEKIGYVERRTGSGTYVTYGAKKQNNCVLGLLLPGFSESEIFESICKQMTKLAEELNIRLVWHGSNSDDIQIRCRQTEKQCAEYIEQNIDGVFFSPLERSAQKDEINQIVCNVFDKVGIPVVLIDRDICGPFERSKHDLIGIDNFRAAYKMTELLLKNCRKIMFVARPYSAPTVDQRIAGYRVALLQAGITPQMEWILIGEPDDRDFVRKLIEPNSPTAVICANDATAAVLMNTLDELNIAIPEQVRVVGFDDMRYASHLRVALTTFRQPCQDIGTAAIHLMLSRIANPSQSIKTITLEGQPIIRKSCGTQMVL